MRLKKYRLKKKEFERVLKKGKGFREDFLVLKVKENNLSKIRVGFLVSKEISKKAVQRNKIRRRLRELIRLRLGKIKESHDIVFIALPGLEKKNFQQMANTVDKIFLKAKIVKDESNFSDI